MRNLMIGIAAAGLLALPAGSAPPRQGTPPDAFPRLERPELTPTRTKWASALNYTNDDFPLSSRSARRSRSSSSRVRRVGGSGGPCRARRTSWTCWARRAVGVQAALLGLGGLSGRRAPWDLLESPGTSGFSEGCRDGRGDGSIASTSSSEVTAQLLSGRVRENKIKQIVAWAQRNPSADIELQVTWTSARPEQYLHGTGRATRRAAVALSLSCALVSFGQRL